MIHHSYRDLLNKDSLKIFNVKKKCTMYFVETCSVDVNFEATCACNGEWSGYYCSGKFI
jgi:hypothetical protein